jgi:predicted enzyme related to lactoylglutathione lyase
MAAPRNVERGLPGASRKHIIRRSKTLDSRARVREQEIPMATGNVGQFVWHDHMTKDPKAAIAFYTDVVGWKTQPFAGAGDYTMWVGSQGPLGGVTKLPDRAAKMGAPPNWMGHVQVDDVDAAAALTKKLGGKVVNEPEDIPTVGRFAVISDPQGAVLSIFEPNASMALHDASKEGEFCWNELVTSDQTAAFAFYSQLLGWKTLQEMDMGAMGTYRIYGVGDQQLGGMMNTPKGNPLPPSWIYYVETRDLEGSITRAKKDGGKLMNGPVDVPGGRIVQLMDPQGALFALHQATKKN